MAITILEIEEAFELLFESFINKDFSKSLYLDHWGEKDLLPLIRTFLLGYFGESLIPEAESELPGSLSGYGRIDFLLGNTAIEFAVRTPECHKSKLKCNINQTEVKKLLKHDGPSVLVLFDFSDCPLSKNELQQYRETPSLGKGNYYKSPFNIIYFYIKKKRPKTSGKEKLNIRI